MNSENNVEKIKDVSIEIDLSSNVNLKEENNIEFTLVEKNVEGKKIWSILDDGDNNTYENKVRLRKKTIGEDVIWTDIDKNNVLMEKFMKEV